MRAVVLALLALCACGTVSGAGSLPLPSPPTAALAKWKEFPAHHKPRPIIAFSNTVDHIQAGGFPSGDRKIAWICNKFVFGSGVTISSVRPASAMAGEATYPAISSQMAWDELAAAHTGGGNPTDCARVQSFVITAVRWGSAGFETDRGMMTMSAWLFDVPEVNAYLGFAAVDPSAFWGGGISEGGRGARITTDGMTLKVPVANAGPGPCGFDYTAATAESDVAVAVAILQIPHASSGAAVACTLELRISYIDVRLNAPLGDRVLVDEHGQPGEVTPVGG